MSITAAKVRAQAQEKAIASPLELSVSAVYTANPLSGDGISIDVEYIPSRRLVIGDVG